MNILDKRFSYVPAVSTNVAATFDRLYPGWRKPKPDDRAERQLEECGLELPKTVVPLPPRKKA